jgi:hypothetical protein
MTHIAKLVEVIRGSGKGWSEAAPKMRVIALENCSHEEPSSSEAEQP